MVSARKRVLEQIAIAAAIGLLGTYLATPAYAEDAAPVPDVAVVTSSDAAIAIGDITGGTIENPTEGADALIHESAQSVDGIAVTEDAVVTLPSDDDLSTGFMSADGQNSMSVTLPAAQEIVGSTDASIMAGEDGESFIVHATSEGGLQVLNVVSEQTDSHAFTVDTGIPEGYVWSPLEGGAYELLDTEGVSVAIVNAPWAVDANGTTLPTSFSIEGGQITQTVDTRGATFPVVADPDFWWILGTSAVCLAEVASLAVGAAKVVQAFAKADKIIKASKTLIKFYNDLGGRMDKVIDLLKKWIKNKSSLTKKQIAALQGLVREGGKFVFNVVGLGTCYALMQAKY